MAGHYSYFTVVLKRRKYSKILDENWRSTNLFAGKVGTSNNKNELEFVIVVVDSVYDVLII